jgi:6-phosphogluconolactonase
VAPLTSPQQRRWHLYDDNASLQQRAARIILRAAREAMNERGAFHIVLAGGSTPRAIYAQLATAPADWSRWHIYFGDERCLPPDHPDRNSHMAQEAWLRHVPLPAAHIHPIPAQLGPERGAQDYACHLADVDRFDLVLLGLGEDGHTASLFPGQDWGMATDGPPTLAVRAAPKPPPERVSLSAARLSRARQVLFLVTGAGKGPPVAQWRHGAAIPADAIRPADGVDILLTVNCFSL